jgi:hypothetical protein
LPFSLLGNNLPVKLAGPSVPVLFPNLMRS